MSAWLTFADISDQILEESLSKYHPTLVKVLFSKSIAKVILINGTIVLCGNLDFTATDCSGLPKAEGLRPKSKVSHLQLPLRLPKVYAAEGRRSSRRLKLLKFSKFKCKFCDKNFRMIKVHVFSVFKKV